MNRLRALAPEQQVALLFVALFGLLALASLALFVRSLRAQESLADAQSLLREQRRWRDLRARWVGAIAFWLSWLSGAVGATLLFGVFSFLALREFITLVRTRRGDHRSLIAAFFVVLPVQYLIVGVRGFDLFSVFVPVYVFFAIPVLGALAGDPQRFLERNAKIQWGIMVCVFGLSHAPALLLLELPRFGERGAFLLFFLVMVVAAAQIVQQAVAERLRRRPVARHISRWFSYRAWGIGALAAAGVGALLVWITPFRAWEALAMGAVAGASGTLGGFVMEALKKDAGVKNWGNQPALTGAVGLLDRVAPLCFAAPVFFHSVRWYASVHP
jgi:phosphatidate cytidylyltransferase